MTAKNKLDASLEGLFSKSAPPAAPAETPVAVEEIAVKESLASNGAKVSTKKLVDSSTSSVAERQLVVFSMANEYYGVDITIVESIIRTEKVTVVPHAPRFVNGVINMRGEVLPVVNLCTRFNLKGNEETTDSRIIVIEVNNLRVGVNVDAVTEVLRVAETLIEPPAPLVATIDSAYICGIAKVPNRLVILLDMEKVMAMDEKAEFSAKVMTG